MRNYPKCKYCGKTLKWYGRTTCRDCYIEHHPNKRKAWGRLKKVKKVLQYDKNGKFLTDWDCLSQVKDLTGRGYYQIKNINKALRGEQKSAYGFIWKYEN